jgi:hypothetical protein
LLEQAKTATSALRELFAALSMLEWYSTPVADLSKDGRGDTIVLVEPSEEECRSIEYTDTDPFLGRPPKECYMR